ncbi:ligase-associated DNA damage response endonuclease PdeM [Thermomonas carbonis]|uniref:Ligase-associated DNA damage response endonuclease PdeM n=1 Tax=Thermomonas carbonis TaxID=1463158 RepID=A0A7G9SQ09_9GAMM|nr:ligase-associated DNA damage response endonuclease PdeM [Thermomonas carbonis]QNN69934.1 ligase-associated DNA damage response endonuclease PdeM [Thermomonas carbonis]GHB96460.1 phosphoesterase [Thermomonas carbonis]
MLETLDIELAGEPVRLLADRAMYWPARRRLFIADLHLGKADTFRAAGIALPRGGTALDLSRISASVDATGATSVWVLGDMLHGRADLSSWRAAWEDFRKLHPRLSIAVVDGNHDRALQQARLDIERLGDAVHDGPFVLRHDPALDPRGHVLCGHLHPVLKLPGQPRTQAFWLQPGCTILPAFSAFTGGYLLRLGEGDSAVLCNGSALLAVGAH